jgi:pyrroloquinoline quinone biosynthesis protein B
MRRLLRVLLFLLVVQATVPAHASGCTVELFVLGAGQDAGAPQIGNPGDPAWDDPDLRLTATSLAVVDHAAGQRFLFEAAPQLTEQLQRLDTWAPANGSGLGLDGVFLTHAHIGHYAGLMFFGREAAGATGIPVHVMPRFAAFLRDNGPWSQLLALGNITVEPLANEVTVAVGPRVKVTPLLVPHRDEYSETVGFVVATPSSSALFLPDIDSWDQWTRETGVPLEDRVRAMNHLFVDATFFADGELPGRDMSQIPHPRVRDTMARLAALPADERRKVRFIHYNHSNPIRYPDSAESAEVAARGFAVARAGDRVCLH